MRLTELQSSDYKCESQSDFKGSFKNRIEGRKERKKQRFRESKAERDFPATI